MIQAASIAHFGLCVCCACNLCWYTTSLSAYRPYSFVVILIERTVWTIDMQAFRTIGISYVTLPKLTWTNGVWNRWVQNQHTLRLISSSWIDILFVTLLTWLMWAEHEKRYGIDEKLNCCEPEAPKYITFESINVYFLYIYYMQTCTYFLSERIHFVDFYYCFSFDSIKLLFSGVKIIWHMFHKCVLLRHSFLGGGYYWR